MKKLIVVALVATTFAACSDSTKSTDVTTVDSDSASVVTTEPMTQTSTTMYSPAEGDVSYRDGRVMVWRNGNYVASDNDVTLDNGIVVNKNGRATRNGEVVVMEDGEVVTRSGRWYNKAGEGIDDAWDATKKGVRKAGNAVEKGANKVGEAVKDAVN